MLRLAAVLAILAAPAWGDCYDRDVLAGYLADRGMVLHSWGINSEGDMEELFLHPESREWAVVRTTPRRCATVVSTPDRHHDRLWEPPRNRAVRPPRRLDEGSPL